MKTYTIDAKGKKLGRVASEASTILIGKNLTTFARNTYPEITVTVVNASQIVADDKKKGEKTYTRYSLFPGGQTVETMAKVIENKGYTEVLRKAIKGMLPKNKLQTPMMKNLIVTE